MLNKPYKDEGGRWLTASLFYETAKKIPLAERYCEPIFSMYEERKGLVCFRTTFVHLEDPTGYQWAMKYLGDYNHWKRLVQTTWFEEAYQNALDELETKLKSEALTIIKEISQRDGDKQALPAARYLASAEWKKAGAGRPSKEAISGELKRRVTQLSAEDEDFERITNPGIKAVK